METSQNNQVAISSIEELEGYLDKQSSICTGLLSQVLKSQMMVLQSVFSERIVLTNIDTIIKYSKEAQKSAVDDNQKEQIKTIFATILTNFVFCLDVRLQFAKKVLREEEHELKKKTVHFIVEGFTTVLAAAEGNTSGAIISVVSKFFNDENNQNSLFDQWSDHNFAEEQTREQEVMFYKSLRGIIDKLEKYNEFIGKDLRLCEMLQNFSSDIVEFETRDLRNTINGDSMSLGCNGCVGLLVFTGIGISYFGYRVYDRFVSNSYATNSWFNDEEVSVDPSFPLDFWIKLAIFIVAILIWWWLIKAQTKDLEQNEAKLKETEKKTKDHIDRVSTLYDETK